MVVRRIGRANPLSISLGEVFVEAFEIYRSNPSIAIPALLPGAWLLTLSIILNVVGISLLSLPFNTNLVGYFACIVGSFVGLLILWFLFLLAEGITVEMVRQASEEGEADLRGAFDGTIERFVPLLVGTVFAGLLMSAGFVLLVIPGIILAFALWFVPQAIMVDYEGGLSAIGASIRFFGENKKAAFLLILLSLALYIILLSVAWIPVLSSILLLIGMPYLVALTTVLYIDRA